MNEISFIVQTLIRNSNRNRLRATVRFDSTQSERDAVIACRNLIRLTTWVVERDTSNFLEHLPQSTTLCDSRGEETNPRLLLRISKRLELR